MQLKNIINEEEGIQNGQLSMRGRLPYNYISNMWGDCWAKFFSKYFFLKGGLNSNVHLDWRYIKD
ncbi:hypothetical protein COE08_21600 [Priestia megaterium]|nr:hypothetical protein COE08_21600 [Priestia megaterium]